MIQSIEITTGQNIILANVSNASMVGLKVDPAGAFISSINFGKTGSYQVEFQALTVGTYYVETDGIINSVAGVSIPIVAQESAKTENNELRVYSEYLAKYTPIREWQCIGMQHTVIPPTPPDTFKQNIFDFRIDPAFAGSDNYVELIGGRYYVRDVEAIHDNDIIEFSIVDKDNILGVFGLYGLVVGQDVLELKKFIRTHSIIGGQIVSFEAGQSKKLPAGLYLRISYTSYGTKEFAFKVDFIIPA